MPRLVFRTKSLVVPTALLVFLAAASACSSEEATDDDGLGAASGGTSGRGRDGGSTGTSSGGDDFESSSGSPSGSSSSGGTNGSSSSSSSSSSSGSSGTPCNDPDDVGDMTSPQQLAPISDGVDEEGTIMGVLSTDDEDAYQRLITDDYGGFLDPYASTSAPNVQLCMYLKCDDDGDITVTCNGSAPDSYSALQKGCCGPVLDIDYECGGITDDVQQYIRVRSTAAQCSQYTIVTKQ